MAFRCTSTLLFAQDMKIKRISLTKWVMLTMFIGVLFWQFVLPWIPIKTAIAYPMLRKRWDPDTVAHFPEVRPEGSESIGFYFNWGMLQAATVMEWRVRFEETSFSKEMQRLSSISEADDARAYGSTYDRQRWTVEFEESGFVPRILHALPTMYGDGPSWNHGATYGYAIRTSTREVVYWVESW